MPRLCCIKDCEKNASSKGFCQKHYYRVRMHGSAEDKKSSHVPPDARFARNFVRGGKGECWEWLGSIHKRTGYGVFSVNRKSVLPHRFSYEFHKGAIPAGLFVLHSCDNRKCVNPNHLRVGTHAENTMDMVARKRHWGKLTPKIVRILRKSEKKTRHLAKEFGVAESTIHNARHGLTWKLVK